MSTLSDLTSVSMSSATASRASRNKIVATGTLRDIISEHMVRTRRYYLQATEKTSNIALLRRHFVSFRPLTQRILPRSRPTCGTQQPLFARSAYDDLGRLIHDTSCNLDVRKESMGSSVIASEIHSLTNQRSTSSSHADPRTTFARPHTPSKAEVLTISSSSGNINTSRVNKTPTSKKKQNQLNFGTKDLSRSRMSVLDRSQPYIAEHSLHGSMSTGELSGLYDDADVNSMQGTPISAHPSKKGILDDSQDEVELKDIDAEFVYNNRNVSREEI